MLNGVYSEWMTVLLNKIKVCTNKRTRKRVPSYINHNARWRAWQNFLRTIVIYIWIMTNGGRLVTKCKLCIPWRSIGNLSERYLHSKCHKVSRQKSKFTPSYTRKNTGAFRWPIFTEITSCEGYLWGTTRLPIQWILGLLSLSAKAAGAWHW